MSILKPAPVDDADAIDRSDQTQPPGLTVDVAEYQGVEVE